MAAGAGRWAENFLRQTIKDKTTKLKKKQLTCRYKDGLDNQSEQSNL